MNAELKRKRDASARLQDEVAGRLAAFENAFFENAFFRREASMKSEKREKKNENRKMKTPV